MSNNRERPARIGSTVSVRWDDQDDTEEYTIVPSHEADWQRAMISEACPFGQAVLGRFPGEVVGIKVNGQQCRVTIVAISDATTSLTAPSGLAATPIGLR